MLPAFRAYILGWQQHLCCCSLLLAWWTAPAINVHPLLLLQSSSISADEPDTGVPVQCCVPNHHERCITTQKMIDKRIEHSEKGWCLDQCSRVQGTRTAGKDDGNSGQAARGRSG